MSARQGFKGLRLLSSIFGLLFGCWLTAALLVPPFVQVDRFRPQLVELFRKHLNAQVEIASLSLSFWGRIEVQVEGLKFTDASRRLTVKAQQSFLHVPLLPLLFGKPVLFYRVDRPEISFVQDGQGQQVSSDLPPSLSVAQSDSSFQRSSVAGKRPVAAMVAAAHPPTVELPGGLLVARFGLTVHDGTLTYQNRAAGALAEVHDLHLELQDVSLRDSARITAKGRMNATSNAPHHSGPPQALNPAEEKKISLGGPFQIDLRVKPQFDLQAGKLLNAGIQAAGDFSDLRLEVPNLLIKDNGMPARFNLKMTFSPSLTRVAALDLQLLNTVFKSGGTLTAASAEGQSPILDYRVSANSIDLSDWSKLLPMGTAYELKGVGSFVSEFTGPLDRLRYQAQVEGKDLSVQIPQFKTVPIAQVSMKISTNQIEDLSVSVKALDNDLLVKGKVISFTTPRADFTVTSNGIDLDRLLVLPPLRAVRVEGASDAQSKSAQSSVLSPVAAPVEASPSAVFAQAVSALQSLSSRIDVRLQSLKVYDLNMNTVRGNLSLKRGEGIFEDASFGIWGGEVKGDLRFDFKDPSPKLQFFVGAEGIDLQKASASPLALFEDTVSGKAFFSFQGSSSGWDRETVLKTIKMNGNWHVLNAHFASVDFRKKVMEAIDKQIGGLPAPLRGLQEKLLKPAFLQKSAYERIGSSFSVSKGLLTVPDLNAKSQSRAGTNIRGSMEILLSEEYPVRAQLELLEPHRFRFPIYVACKLGDPCFTATYNTAVSKTAVNKTVDYEKAKRTK
jgi:hypothetical protein